VSGGSVGSNVDISSSSGPTDVSAAPRDAQSTIGDATGGTRTGEAGVMREVGPEGTSIAHGRAPGASERELTGEGEISARTGEARGFQQGQGMEARAGIDDARDGAVETSGYRDPVSEAGRVETLEFKQRDHIAARAAVTTDKVGEAQRAAADPRAAASGEASVRIDDKTGDARGDAGHVSDAVRDPGATAQAKADAKLAEQKRDATGDVSVSASVSTSTDKPSDKK